ncbi:hypothetical protein ACFW2V_13380 [Streptomyces sp. NPDC058947]|uniref:hypothetical protein n=1 Tax=Streptomyces sp. NPDC058947 TaxID=3346675 RepID=UPI0036C2962B
MDLMQMAGHLSLEFGVVVEGPFGGSNMQSVRLWMPNRRGLSLLFRPGIDKPGTVDMLVIREKLPDSDVTYTGTPWRDDYSTPITNDHLPGTDIDTARAALRILRELPEVDVRDLRNTRDMRAKGFIHYGHSTTACGDLGPDDTVTEHVSGIRCLPCMVGVHRSV